VTDASQLAHEVLAARARLIEFVGRCTDDQWTARPLTEDPRAVAVIVDHVADAYEYLGSFVGELSRGEPVEVSGAIVDELNARHASAVRAPTREAVIDHLARSGDDFVACIEPMDAHQLAGEGGRVTIARFAQIAALHADDHRVALEEALGLI
jgi:hypothetical protein